VAWSVPIVNVALQHLQIMTLTLRVGTND